MGGNHLRLIVLAVSCSTVLTGFAGTPAVSGSPSLVTWPSHAVAFEPNLGQADSAARFVARAGGGALFVEPDAATLAVGGETLLATRASFPGARSDAVVVGDRLLPGVSHYLTDADASRWIRDVPRYARAVVRDAYPGVDIAWYGAPDGAIEYDFVIAPGASAEAIRIRLDGPAGPARLADGALVTDLGGATVAMRAPVAYQPRDGGRVPVAAAFRAVAPGEFALDVGAFDATRPLVVDPVLGFSTFIGGRGYDGASGVAASTTGDVFVAGWSLSFDFPLRRPVQLTNRGSWDGFAARYSRDGALMWSTYLGGEGADVANAIAVDASGRAVVAGTLGSNRFPVPSGAPRPVLRGPSDAFVITISPAGDDVVDARFFGGSGVDHGNGLAVLADGGLVLAGTTTSTDLPTTVAASQRRSGGDLDAFVARYAPSGAIASLTYLGGSGADWACSYRLSQCNWPLGVDATGNAIIAGGTESTDFPTTDGAFQRARAGVRDAYVAKVKPDGGLAFATYYGGTGDDHALAAGADAAGRAYFAGLTEHGAGVPTTPLSAQPAYAGNVDGFVAALDPTGRVLLQGTHLGGAQIDVPGGMAVDAAGGVVVTGSTRSADFPGGLAGGPGAHAGSHDLYVARLAPGGTHLAWSVLLGSPGDEAGRAVALDPLGGIAIAGITTDGRFPVANATQPAYAGNVDGVLLRLEAA